MTHTTTTLGGERGGLHPLLESGVIAVARLPAAAGLRAAARALAAGGVGAVEITLTTPGAIEAIGELASDRDLACVVGAGTVLDESAACEVIDAGARFVVSPTLTPAVIRVCRDRDIPCMPGAFTPTEIVEAWRAGAPLVKLFPAAPVGPGYLRDLLAPLPFLRLVPSGGVSLENVGDWIRAGAVAVSVGSALLPAALVRSEAAGGAGGAELTLRARAFVERVAQARAQLAGGAA
ncbi:MAG TPA: bifunctional 4-hydroxy-2-oxoglutarate aldolase/2-dehydro-3-deoxy-phosphogluconate aldolase [Gemmatimonadales bacterium]|nr:bifunctional 4-hydroxy-2-oxoglutarate aldolase/2-dehydro-3-deoxy-phosphogluconate aldolase [Gemmatimonadales bacterium]